MDLQSLVTWNGMPPEYILEGLWYVTISDYANNQGYYKTTIPSPDFLDPFVTEVTIPQVSLSYKKTDYDMINFEEKDEVSSIQITFCDDTQGTCLSFFDSWRDSIFDTQSNCLRNRWRYQCRFLTAHLIRILKQSDSQTTVSTQEKAEIIESNSLGNKLKGIEVQDVASFLISGCMPKGIQEIPLESDSGDRQSFTVELECEGVKDYFRKRDREDGQVLMTYRT